ncbi:MAG: HDOD domain-containing protein [Acidobacteria bacterium]|nr:HDOD domain-containing protein [Acidobacteriota bacterium]MBI3425675.1 HDOD domain-containing protein [Acidobacteriota bacterium]
MRRILFVDDEPKILQGLQRMLRPMRHEWEMSFTESGEQALAFLAERPFDVVVSDMRMPGMNGAQLLTQVRLNHPHVVRIILSGYSDYDLIFKSVGPAHQYLSKPCEAETLKLTVNRACALRDLLSNESLQLLVSQMQSLPSLPSLYHELLEELQSPGVTLKKVGEVIARDLGMTAKILQMVNSAFFGLRRQISSPAEAVSLLGLETVMTLVMTIQIFSQFSSTLSRGFSPEALYDHSMRVAMCAKQVALAQGEAIDLANDAFTAGLLHDVGHLVLAANMPESYGRLLALVRANELPFDDCERQVFGATHAEIGAYLLGLWGLPNAIVETVAFHDQPRACQVEGFSALSAVHIANALEHELHAQCDLCGSTKLDEEYLTRLGINDRVAVWRAGCFQNTQLAAA